MDRELNSVIKKKIDEMNSGEKFVITKEWCEKQGIFDVLVRGWGRTIARDPEKFGLLKDNSVGEFANNKTSNNLRHYIKK